MTVLHVCDEPGCGEILKSGTRCPEHMAARALRRAPQTAARAIRNTRRWKQVSRLARERDGNRCTFGLEPGDRGAQAYPGGRCPVTSGLEGHHVVPLEDGGAAYDLRNVRTLCATHHARAEAQERARRG